ncbi:unannotated protein [freshwater metagenome]|uniref:Unannotated protein n=1 Tax=freshwater metagenome TaxID=449393 RepID=A0A6J6ZVR5_9ZZZZ
MESHNGIARTSLGPKFFWLTAKVLRDDCIGSIENILCTAIVLFENNHAHFIKGIFKLSDVTEVGTAECINRLIGVAHHAHVVMTGRQTEHDFVLRNVRVLIFVYQDVLESVLVRSQNIGMHTEQTHDIHQQVVKVHCSGFEQTLLIFTVNLGVFAVKNMGCSFGGLRGRNQFVLPIRNHCMHGSGREALDIKSHIANDVAREPLCIGLVVNTESLGVPNTFAMNAQNSHARRVERRYPH